MSEDLVKEMHESFRRSEELLDLESTQKDPVQEKKEDSQDKIASSNPKQVPELAKELHQQVPAQTVASSEQAEKLIAEGWKFVAILPNQKIVLEKIF